MTHNFEKSKFTSKKVHVNGRLDAGKFIEKSGNIKVDLYNCGSSSDSVAGNIKMDYLFVHPIKLQKDEPVDTLWPRLGLGIFIEVIFLASSSNLIFA